MKLYLAGPMSGYPRWNFDAFTDAAARLRTEGHEVVSPHETDLALGFDPDAPVEHFTVTDYYAAMRRDLAMILDGVEMIATLPGWEKSRGAKAEVATAAYIGVPTLSVEALLSPPWAALKLEETV